jgi:hypothetical protein
MNILIFPESTGLPSSSGNAESKFQSAIVSPFTAPSLLTTSVMLELAMMDLPAKSTKSRPGESTLMGNLASIPITSRKLSSPDDTPDELVKIARLRGNDWKTLKMGNIRKVPTRGPQQKKSAPVPPSGTNMGHCLRTVEEVLECRGRFPTASRTTSAPS